MLQAPGNPPRPISVRAWKPFAIAVILIVVLSLVLDIGVYVAYERVECSLGGAVSTEMMITPIALLNTPYGGLAWTFNGGPTYTFASGGLVLATTIGSPQMSFGTSSNGKWTYLPVGEFSGFNWTLYSVKNSTVFTTSQAHPCTTAFVAAPAASTRMPGQPIPWIEVAPLTLPNNTTDLGEPHIALSVHGPYPYNLSAYTAVRFDNGFHTPNYPTVDTCGSSVPQEITVNGSVSIPISVSLSGPSGHNVTVSGTFTYPSGVSNDTVMHYYFPANAGSWDVYSPSGTNVSGALAFQYYPCG